MTTPKENDGETLQRLSAEEERQALEDRQAIQGQKKLERWAAERVKRWGKPQPDDYDFQSWTKKDASKELLEAGCIYEYVRESRKLRGLLTLCKLARSRRNLAWSFEGFGEVDARARLGGAFDWLFGLADQLADNESFAKLFHARGAELKRSLAKRPFDFPRSNAVKLSEPFFLTMGGRLGRRGLRGCLASIGAHRGFPF